MNRDWGRWLAVLCAATLPIAAGRGGVDIRKNESSLRVEIDGTLFTEYVFRGVPKPVCYPLLGPDGTDMTRHWPMKKADGEDQDHPHHRSLWFTHGSVNGVDFWSELPRAGRIEHVEFLEIKPGPDSGVIRSANRWIANDGKVVCTDERTLRFFAGAPNQRKLDFAITLKAGDTPVVFGDTKEGSFGIRLNESLRVKPNKDHKIPGRILNSAGDKDTAAWGKRAAWCLYSGPIDGKPHAVAILDHPKNPRHPTWWHVRDYGLFAANPFGQHDFEKKPAGTGDFTIPAGQSATFRYRVILIAGESTPERIQAEFKRFASE